MKKQITCPAGEWTTLVSNFGSGIPRTFTVRLSGGPVSGAWMEKRHWWIFPQTPTVGELAPEMSFHRRWINAIYSIKVKPDHDLIAHVT
jgi:hypothetical protein